MEARVRRSLRVALFALSIGFVVALTAGASATPGPGGWDNLGTGSKPTSPAFVDVVYALNSDAPGVLYAGGRFIDAGGDLSADFLAQWKNGRWTRAVSVPLTASVNAIAYRAGKLYVGGVFVNAGGNPNADYLAVWDGTKWGTVCNATGPPIGGNVLALQIVGSTIYVGGTFQNGAGIASADYLLACDLATGAPRSTVAKDGEFSGPVYALTADSKGNLYAGGRFGNLAGVPATDNVAYFNGSGWHAMGTGPGQGGGAVDSFVRGLTANGTNVYVGTDSVNIAGIALADHVAKWNGSAWSAMGSNSAGGDGWFPASTFINALTTSGSRVFAAGSFQNANGDKLADMVAEFDGKAWQPVGSNGAGDGPLKGNVSALTTFDKDLVAGGLFVNAGGNDLADFLASYPLAGAPPGGGPPTTTTTTPGGAAAPPTGTPTGTVLVNGRPFAGGTIPYRSTGRRHGRPAPAPGRHGHLDGQGRRRHLGGVRAPPRYRQEAVGRGAPPDAGRLQHLPEAQEEQCQPNRSNAGPPALGRRHGPLQDTRQVCRGDGSRHQLADGRPLRRNPYEGRSWSDPGHRPSAAAADHRAGGSDLPREAVATAAPLASVKGAACRRGCVRATPPRPRPSASRCGAPTSACDERRDGRPEQSRDRRHRGRPERRLADSNCCKRLCRPLPNHSAKAPEGAWYAKVSRAQAVTALRLTPARAKLPSAVWPALAWISARTAVRSRSPRFSIARAIGPRSSLTNAHSSSESAKR